MYLFNMPKPSVSLVISANSQGIMHCPSATILQ